MPLLLHDRAVTEEISACRSFLEREEWYVVGVPLAKLMRRASAVHPDILLLSDREGDPFAAIDVLRGDPELVDLRIMLLLSSALGAGWTEALRGMGVTVAELPIPAEALSAALAALHSVPTRVTLRRPVALDVGELNGPAELAFGRMIDLSTGGFRLESGRELAAGQTVSCFFSLDEGVAAIHTRARVVRRGPNGGGLFQYGLEFAEMRLDDRHRIASHVLERCRGLAGGSPPPSSPALATEPQDG